LAEVALYTNIVGESSDLQRSLAQFRSRFTKESLVSFEEISIDGRPAAIAQFRMINPIDTFMMYQSFIPDSNRSISTIAYSPVREFGSYKETFRKVIMSTRVSAVPKRQRGNQQSGERC
jgi:transposase